MKVGWYFEVEHECTFNTRSNLTKYWRATMKRWRVHYHPLMLNFAQSPSPSTITHRAQEQGSRAAHSAPHWPHSVIAWGVNCAALELALGLSPPLSLTGPFGYSPQCHCTCVESLLTVLHLSLPSLRLLLGHSLGSTSWQPTVSQHTTKSDHTVWQWQSNIYPQGCLNFENQMFEITGSASYYRCHSTTVTHSFLSHPQLWYIKCVQLLSELCQCMISRGTTVPDAHPMTC